MLNWPGSTEFTLNQLLTFFRINKMNKTTLFISSIILTLSSFFTTTTFATSHEKAEEAECVTQAALA